MIRALLALTLLVGITNVSFSAEEETTASETEETTAAK